MTARTGRRARRPVRVADDERRVCRAHGGDLVKSLRVIAVTVAPSFSPEQSRGTARAEEDSLRRFPVPSADRRHVARPSHWRPAVSARASSILYFQGENTRTCPHSRSDAPTEVAAFQDKRLDAASTSRAAAASPTGPAPMTATGRAFISRPSAYPFIFPEISKYEDEKRDVQRPPLRGCLTQPRRRSIRRRDSRSAHSCAGSWPCRSASSPDDPGHQPCIDEPFKMVRESRCRDVELLLEPPDRQAVVTGAHKRPVNAETGHVAERFELRCCFFDNHGNRISRVVKPVNHISTNFEITHSVRPD